MTALLSSPLRNLASIIAFVLVVGVMATLGYMGAGWSFGDAAYMVILTVYTVGYGEVHPIDTPYLHAVTVGLMILGCTGMILLTGALVQVFTISEIKQLIGGARVKGDIDKLSNHVIVCGFGRIGVMLAKELKAGRAAFVIVERSDQRRQQALDLGYLCVQGDATDEAALIAAGIGRARILATVLPDDAANVFITLSARSLNGGLQIIARGEAPTTEGKLIQAGANQVIMPTHIGAERIAEMILFPQTASFIVGSERMKDFEATLRELGMEIEVVSVAAGTPAVGMTLKALEQRAEGAFFVTQLKRRGRPAILRPPGGLTIEPDDELVLVGRGEGAYGALFSGQA